MSGFIERVVGDIGDKKRWRAYKTRVKGLPVPYRSVAEAEVAGAQVMGTHS